MIDADREELETLLTERDALRAENKRLRRERDALSDEVERLRQRVPMCVPTAEGFRRVGGRRLLAACQSLHRAWKRERDLVDRYQRDHDDWMWNTDTCDCAICNDVRMTK